MGDGRAKNNGIMRGWRRAIGASQCGTSGEVEDGVLSGVVLVCDAGSLREGFGPIWASGANQKGAASDGGPSLLCHHLIERPGRCYLEDHAGGRECIDGVAVVWLHVRRMIAGICIYVSEVAQITSIAVSIDD